MQCQRAAVLDLASVNISGARCLRQEARCGADAQASKLDQPGGRCNVVDCPRSEKLHPHKANHIAETRDEQPARSLVCKAAADS